MYIWKVDARLCELTADRRPANGLQALRSHWSPQHLFHNRQKFGQAESDKEGHQEAEGFRPTAMGREDLDASMGSFHNLDGSRE